MLGDPPPKVLAPIYEEFQRWRELLKAEIQGYLLNTNQVGQFRYMQQRYKPSILV